MTSQTIAEQLAEWRECERPLRRRCTVCRDVETAAEVRVVGVCAALPWGTAVEYRCATCAARGRVKGKKGVR